MRARAAAAIARIVLVAASGWLLPGCSDVDSLVSDERAALERFESIASGAHEDEVRAKLGPPSCVVTSDRPGAETVTVRCPESGAAQVLSLVDRGSLPFPLWTFPAEMPTRRVLFYEEGTVFARYCVDDDGRVVRVEVTVS